MRTLTASMTIASAVLLSASALAAPQPVTSLDLQAYSAGDARKAVVEALSDIGAETRIGEVRSRDGRFEIELRNSAGLTLGEVHVARPATPGLLTEKQAADTVRSFLGGIDAPGARVGLVSHKGDHFIVRILRADGVHVADLRVDATTGALSAA